MADYMFSARARRRRPVKVQRCEFDGYPCEFCPGRCRVIRYKQTLLSQVKGAADRYITNSVLEAFREQVRRGRPKAQLR